MEIIEFREGTSIGNNIPFTDRHWLVWDDNIGLGIIENMCEIYYKDKKFTKIRFYGN